MGELATLVLVCLAAGGCVGVFLDIMIWRPRRARRHAELTAAYYAKRGPWPPRKKRRNL